MSLDLPEDPLSILIYGVAWLEQGGGQPGWREDHGHCFLRLLWGKRKALDDTYTVPHKDTYLEINIYI